MLHTSVTVYPLVHFQDQHPIKHGVETHQMSVASKSLVARLPYTPDEKRCKLDSKIVECVFIEYVADKKAYWCIDWGTGTVYESWDVIFDEGVTIGDEQVEVEPSLDIEHDVTSSPSAAITEEEDNNLLDLLENIDEDNEDDEEDNEDENPPVVPPLAPSSPPQLGPCHSTRIHCPPVPDDDSRYEVTSYAPK